jgi:hypothetical protein
MLVTLRSPGWICDFISEGSREDDQSDEVDKQGEVEARTAKRMGKQL